MGLNKLLKAVTEEITHNNVPYMLIGGQAVLIYGEPRLTKDIDITLGAGAEAYKILLNIVQKLNLKILISDPLPFMKRTLVLPVSDEESGFRIDFIFSYTPYERQAIDRAVTKEIDNAKIKFASLEDLVIHKIFAGRPRDIEDVKNVLLKNPVFDKNYIEKWLAEFDKIEVSNKFLEIFETILEEIK